MPTLPLPVQLITRYEPVPSEEFVGYVKIISNDVLPRYELMSGSWRVMVAAWESSVGAGGGAGDGSACGSEATRVDRWWHIFFKCRRRHWTRQQGRGRFPNPRRFIGLPMSICGPCHISHARIHSLVKPRHNEYKPHIFVGVT
jgi:hypothetical protein